MREMQEEWGIERSYQRRNDQPRPKSKKVGGFEREESVWEVKRQVSVERDRKNEIWFCAETI